MKILFSVYKEDFETSVVELIDSVWVQTDWSAAKITEHLDSYDGFHSVIVFGEHLSFFDYYCFFDTYNELLAKIRTIPYGENQNKLIRTPYLFRVSKSNPGNEDFPEYPNDSHQYLFELEYYKCGAGGFGTIILWAAAHPLEMVFIGGVVYDFCKWLFSKILCGIEKKRSTSDIRPVVLNTKRLYQNFSKATSFKVADCQITKFHRLSVGVFHVTIRTSTDMRYKLKCKANGTIEALEEITKV